MSDDEKPWAKAWQAVGEALTVGFIVAGICVLVYLNLRY